MLWYAFLFVVGAASTALEIAGLRFLAPLFGTSLPVWGAAIATVIAGLALGYAHGGRRARPDTSAAAVAQHAASAAALFLLMPAVYALASVAPGALALLLAFSILLIPSFIFGAVSPLAVQVEAGRTGKPAGQVAGKISSLTTLGSLAGILVPSFLTIPWLGTRETTWIFAGAVLILSLPLILPARQSKSRTILVFALIAAFTSLMPAAREPEIIFTAETPYQHVAVRQHGSTRALTFDAALGIQSVSTPETYTNGYWDYLAALPAFLPQKNINVLVLGAAASTTERQMEKFWKDHKRFEFTSVELDGDLFPIADAYFAAPARVKIASDARLFVARDTQQYDIIVVDAYARELTIPFHLATAEFFEALAPRLAEDGILAVNANATSNNSLWIRSLAHTAGESFPHLRLASVPHSCNHLLLVYPASPAEALAKAGAIPPAVEPLIPVLQNAPEPDMSGILLTDNRAPTDWLGLIALIAGQKTPACA